VHCEKTREKPLFSHSPVAAGELARIQWRQKGPPRRHGALSAARKYTMQRTIAFVLGIGLVCFSLASLAAAADDKPPAGFDPSKAMTEMQQQFMLQFDVNKDGKLNDQEKMMAQEAMRRQGWNFGIAPSGSFMDQFSKQFDANHDGQLSPVEAFAAQQAFQRIRNHGNGGGIRSGGGGGAMQPQGFAPVAPAGDHKGDKVSPLIKRFDKDGDGKLNAEEKAAAQAELKKKDKEKAKDAKAKDKAKK
jgi:hypothetical protein